MAPPPIELTADKPPRSPWLCCASASAVVAAGPLDRSGPPTPLDLGDGPCPSAPLLRLEGRRALDRALRHHAFARPPSPATSDQPSESDALRGDELAVADAIRAKLGPDALALLDDETALLPMRRTVRGYWTYRDRVDASVVSLDHAARFRKELGLDALNGDEPAARDDADALLRKWENMSFCGYDRSGHPVVVERVKASLELVNRAEEDPDDLLRGRAVCTEVFQALKRAAATRRDEPADVLKHVYVIDMTHVRLSMVTSRCRERFQRIMTTLEEVYPEVAWRTYVVNAPSYLMVIWYVVKGWLDKVTSDKVVLMGTDVRRARERMLADGVPLSSIPACCGGPARETSLRKLFSGDACDTPSAVVAVATPFAEAAPPKGDDAAAPSKAPVVVAASVAMAGGLALAVWAEVLVF